MSYVVAVKRIINLPEVIALVAIDASLRIARQDADTLDVTWSLGNEHGFFQLVQGELQATTPSAPAAQKLASIAEALNASVVGEEDLVPQSSRSIQRGVFAGRSTWIGWPLLVMVLGALLAWRW